MIEIPESLTLAKQMNEVIQGKVISEVDAAHTKHGFAWYAGDPAEYDEKMSGLTVGKASGIGSLAEFAVGDLVFAVGDGTNIRYYEPDSKLPTKYQTRIGFEDGSNLVCTVAMYGSMSLFDPKNYENEFYWGSKRKPLPTTEGFTREYFRTLFDEEGMKMSAKAFFATKQRIPGLGNGVLQDILLAAGLHPKRKMDTLTEDQREGLYDTLLNVLNEMIAGGGRNTERDLFGNEGGYCTKLSKKNPGYCPICGGVVEKSNFLGGSIYVCSNCQPLVK